MFPKLGGLPDSHLFAVFDGHGVYGKEISSFLTQHMPSMLISDSSWPRKPQIALRNTAAQVNEKLKCHVSGSYNSGSAGCICLVHGDEIISANTGDSRAIIGVKVGGGSNIRPQQITEDQTAKNSKERSRILAQGGRIIGDRIYCAHSDDPGLIPSRTYGDFSGMSAGIICNPDIQVQPIDKNTQWLAIMSDGVWENVASSKISSIILNSNGLKAAATDIVLEAKRVIISGKRYRDDMTVVLAQFHNYGHSGTGHSNSSKNTRRGTPSAAEDAEITEEEMIIQSIEVCQEAMEQGVHADDALDSLVGQSEEVKQRVREILQRGDN